MTKLVTIARFNMPNEVMVVKGRLESEDIPCFTKDEYIVQVHNFVSNAVGGIKLQVREEDVQKAKDILLEAGYEKQMEVEENDDQPIDRLDRPTSKIPLIGRLPLVFRLLVIAIILVTILVLAIYYLVEA